jgi:hypothetical protein
VVPFWAFASPAVAKVSATPTVSPTGRSIDDEAFRAAHRASQSVSHWLGTPRSAEVLGRIFHGGEALSSNHLADIFEREAGDCRLELRSHHELSGAFGAFTPRGANGRPTLYLNADWLHCGASDAAVQRVLVEEMGHLIDHLLHPGIDSPGDEGQLFAAAVLGQEPGSQELVEIQQEDDSLVLTIDGSRLLVECAANIVDAKFSAFDFSVGSGDQRIAGSANTPGESWLYLDVLTIDGKTVDAIVTFDSISSGSSMTTFDSNSNPYGSAITWGSSANFLQPNFTWGAGGGSADFSIRFIESGSYNASSNPSGSPLILRNVLANSYDVDSTTTSSSAQYTIFSNIGGLELHGSTQLAVTGDSAQTQISAIGFPGNIQADPGTETGDKYRVRVSYDELPVLSFTVGANGSGIAYYSIDVGPGPGFTSVQNFDLLLGGGEVVTSESGTSDTFTLVLGAQPSSDVTISLTDLDTSEGALSTTSLTFTPANWATPQQITVTGVADALVDGDVKYTLKAQASSTDLRFDGRMVLVDVTNLDVLPPVDGPLTVSNVVVNEASPFAVFTVSGEAGQKAMLSLSNGTAGSADYGPGLETFDGTKWVPYTTGALVSLDANGKLLVRTPIQQDTAFENSETFTLTATNTSGSPGSGTGTIKDDGTGDIFLADNKAATPSLPTDPGYPTLDDDRALTVSSVTVNEASPFAVFTVSGQPGQKAMLSLSNGTAGSADYGPGLETFDGTKWVPYTTGALVSLDANGKLLVRTPIQKDSLQETSEIFSLVATNTSGTPATGNADIRDDGTGDIFGPDGAPDPIAPKDDDRPLAVSSPVVNEGSPYAVFTVSGASGQLASFALADGTAGSADYGPTLEFFDGSRWVAYVNGTQVTLDKNGTLLLRTPVTNDGITEISEKFDLIATNTGGTAAVGTAEIRDDGKGTVFGPLGQPDPAAINDDDRPLTVSNVTAHESLGYAVFTVGGAQDQLVSLDTRDGTATEGSGDFGPGLEYFDGANWIAYTGGYVSLSTAGQIQVRISLKDDGVAEGLENFQLAARNTGYDGTLGEYRGTARVPERIVELYVMENETFISPYASHFSGYSGYHIVGGPDDVMFVSDAASTNLEFKLPATYFLGGDNQHRVVVEANDPGADPDQALFIVNVMSFKAISLTPLGSLRLDRQSGLYKQQLRVANLHVHPIGGLRFTVSLIPGATLFNANTTTVGGEGAIRYDGVLAGINEVGSSFDVTVEVLYKSLSSTNGGAGATLPDPLYRPDLIVMEPSGPPPAPDSTAPTVSFVRLFNGDSMIEWETVVGETYAVEYSSDLRTWIRVNPLIVANSHRTQWIDNGLPKTMSHPSAAGSRFYRVVLLK